MRGYSLHTETYFYFIEKFSYEISKLRAASGECRKWDSFLEITAVVAPVVRREVCDVNMVRRDGELPCEQSADSGRHLGGFGGRRRAEGFYFHVCDITAAALKRQACLRLVTGHDPVFSFSEAFPGDVAVFGGQAVFFYVA